VSLLIASLNGKIPLLNIYGSNQVKTDWRDILIRLFQQLGFDNPDPINTDAEGRALPDSKQLVVNLIDYLDSDEESFPADGILPQGIEGELPNGQKFRNSGTIDSLANELTSIPGFSPARVQKLLPFISKNRFTDINVNAAPLEVLASVLSDPTRAQSIVQCRDPFQGGMPIQDPQQELQTRCGITDLNLSKFRGQGQWFEVIAKVEYGTAVFMASGELSTNGRTGRPPKITSFQVY
jgi:type II secretory pathway component PulK